MIHRVVVQQHHLDSHQWRAHFEDAPYDQFTDETPLTTFGRLIDAHPDRGIEPGPFEIVENGGLRSVYEVWLPTRSRGGISSA